MGRAFRSLATVVLLAAAAPTAALSAETSVADTILEKAIASYRDGNLEPALGGINAALRGGLSSGLTARALYYRGLVYRKQGSPGHAISDLTRALDYDGLSDQERSDAMEARAAAYQEAGVANQEVVVISPATGGERKPPSQPPPQTTAAIVSPQRRSPPQRTGAERRKSQPMPRCRCRPRVPRRSLLGAEQRSLPRRRSRRKPGEASGEARASAGTREALGDGSQEASHRN